MTTAPSTAFFEPRKILVRGVNWLGDAVMTTPALARLRERFPNAHITLLTQEKLGEFWCGHPSLDEVMWFAPREWVGSVARRLRLESFDAALIFPNSPRSALEAFLAGIRCRLGYAARWRQWLLTTALPPRPGRVSMRKLSAGEVKRRTRAVAPVRPVARFSASPAAHHLHDYLHLVAAWGASPAPVAPQAAVSPDEVQAAEQTWLPGLRRRRAPGAADAPFTLLGLNPGAEYGPAKRWPAEKFAAMARAVADRRPGLVWLLFGGVRDESLCAEIARMAGDCVLNLAGKTTLRELMALLKSCRVVVTNDTGPMHLAAALGATVVVPFGSTSPELTGPGLPGDPRHRLLRSEVVCAPCFRRSCPIDFRCMAAIGVDQVVAEVLTALR